MSDKKRQGHDILIKNLEGGGFKVYQGDKRTGKLCYGEVIDIVSCLLVPDHKPSLQWLKTEKEHKVWKDRITRAGRKLKNEDNNEPSTSN